MEQGYPDFFAKGGSMVVCEVPEISEPEADPRCGGIAGIEETEQVRVYAGLNILLGGRRFEKDRDSCSLLADLGRQFREGGGSHFPGDAGEGGKVYERLPDTRADERGAHNASRTGQLQRAGDRSRGEIA